MKENLKTPIHKGDHVIGNPKASIDLVEYGDYECPYCGAAYPIIKKIQADLKSDLKFVFRNFPLIEIHPHALHAAMAAEAAALQGKFWEMHDLLFENQQFLTPKDLVKYAQKLNLDMKAFETAMESKHIKGRIDKDFDSGIRSGVNGTPTFYINGEKYNGYTEEASLLQALKPQIQLH
jgi:protein-disulfide isomerase